MLALLPFLYAEAPVRLERVDLIAEDPGLWINDDIPALFKAPLDPALRFVGQMKVVWGLPVEGLTIGTSLQSQSRHYERTIFGFQSITAGAGLQTSLLLPRGLWVDAAWHRGPMRLALGLSVLSGASWTHLHWDQWRFLPTVGIGIGRVWEQ
jgi:hypothetical protein